MTIEDEKTSARPLNPYETAVADYKGVEFGQPPRFRDPKNARRQMGRSINSRIDKDAPFGSD